MQGRHFCYAIKIKVAQMVFTSKLGILDPILLNVTSPHFLFCGPYILNVMTRQQCTYKVLPTSIKIFGDSDATLSVPCTKGNTPQKPKSKLLIAPSLKLTHLNIVSMRPQQGDGIKTLGFSFQPIRSCEVIFSKYFYST